MSMSISLQTDMMSVKAQRSLSNVTKDITRTMGHLSTGEKINSASDDAANLSLSTNLIAKRSGINVATKNGQTGLTKIQTFESYLGNMGKSIQKMRDLAIQAANGTYSSSEKAMIEDHAQQLKDEILQTTKIANQGMGEDINNFSIQIGENGDSASNIDMGDIAIDFTGKIDIDFSTEDNARLSVEELDQALQYISDERSKLGSFVTKIEDAIGINGLRNNNLAASCSTIRDTDVAEKSAELAKDQIIRNSAASLLQQSKDIRSGYLLGMY